MLCVAIGQSENFTLLRGNCEERDTHKLCAQEERQKIFEKKRQPTFYCINILRYQETKMAKFIKSGKVGM